MRKISVLNLKGGIGKTATSTSLAYLLAKEFDKKVLLIDCDQQGNASMIFNIYDEEAKGTHNLLTCDEDIVNLMHEVDNNLVVIGTNMYLMKANAEILMDCDSNQVELFKSQLEAVEDVFDYCIFDCGLSLDMCVLNALVTSDLVIAPIKYGGHEIRGLEELLGQVEDLKGLNSDIRVKALMTMKQSNKTTREFEKWLKEESGFDVFKTSIRRSIIAEKAAHNMKPIPLQSKNGIVTKDYRELAKKVIKEMEE